MRSRSAMFHVHVPRRRPRHFIHSVTFPLCHDALAGESVVFLKIAAAMTSDRFFCKAFHRRSRRGKVFKVLEEHYLRDDLGCGTRMVQGRSVGQAPMNESNPLAAGNAVQLSAAELRGLVETGGFLSVLDANVLLHQIDLLEAPSAALGPCVLLQTVLEEVRHRDLKLYKRGRALLLDESRAFIFFANEHHVSTHITRLRDETPNDRNDRAIRVAAKWLDRQLQEAVPRGEEEDKCEIVVQLLSNDRENLRKAVEADLNCHSVHDFLASLGADHAALLDHLAPMESELEADVGDEEAMDEGGHGNTLYADHLPEAALKDGLRRKLFFRGTLRCAGKDWTDCYVVVRNETGDRLAVQLSGKENVNRAIEGDLVVVEILPDEEWSEPGKAASPDSGRMASSGGDLGTIGEDVGEASIEAMENLPEIRTTSARLQGPRRPHGRVVGVLKRRWRQYAGSLLKPEKLEGSSESGLATRWFLPVDARIPAITIRTRQAALLEKKRVLVAMDGWAPNSPFPRGHYVRSLGTIGDKGVETAVVLHEHDIPCEPFTEEVMRCLPPSDWKISPDNSVGRRDLRGLPILSIDPPGCKDIDDALHCRELPNKNWEVGVHIADVTHFVKPETPLDLEAAKRSTSTYLVDRRIDMLPGLLTTQLCSLRSTEDHFAFSVLWEMTAEGQIINVDFAKTLIRSIASLTYAQAQDMIDDRSEEQLSVETVAVKQLAKLARIFRLRRVAAGALTLASPEVKFKMDSESLNPTDLQSYAVSEANSLVEEFMLLANITVGKKILRHYPTLSILRRHPAPSLQQFEALVSVARSTGVVLDVSTSKRLADSLDGAERDGDAYFNKLLRILATRCMTPAQYFCSGELPQEDWHHYGLAAPIYTHFTSPIRRYADIVVHRLLAATIGVAPLPAALMRRENLRDLADNMNRRHRAAQMAGRSSVALHTQLYFKDKIVQEKAYVLSVARDVLSVLVPRYGIEGVVHLNLYDVEHDAENHALKFGSAAQSSLTIRVLQAVSIEISVDASLEGRHAVRLKILEPDLSAFACEGLSAEHDLLKEPEESSSKKRRKNDRNTASRTRKRQKKQR